MPNGEKSDFEVECDVVSEYAFAMATAAESLLRYSDRMQLARSSDERNAIRRQHAGLLKRAVESHRIAFAAMTSSKEKKFKKTSLRNWSLALLLRVSSFFARFTSLAKDSK